MKLRLLNGAHSSLAYLGYLAGYETVSDAMADAAFAGSRAGVMDEAATDPSGAARRRPRRLQGGADRALREPGAEAPHLADLHGRQPKAAAAAARHDPRPARAGAPFDRLRLGVAAWMRYVTGIDEKGKPIDVRDPLAARLRAIADEAGLVADRLAPALLEVREIFTAELAADPRFRDAVTSALSRIIAKGAKEAVAEAENLSRVRGARLRDQCGDRGLVERFHERRDAAPDGRSSSRSTADTGAFDMIWSSGPQALKRGSIARITCPTRIAPGAIARRTPPWGPRIVSTRPALLSVLISLKIFCSVMPVPAAIAATLASVGCCAAQ